MRLLVATRSAGKTREIRELFRGLPIDVVFPGDLGLKRLPEEADLEQGTTYAENAATKARHFAGRAGLPTVADDSGIEVDALGGAPGVYSARWAGADGDDQDVRNNAKLLEALREVPEPQRRARYRCVVAYLEARDASPEIVEATCDGAILPAPQGTGGFGYDPLFLSDDLGISFGQAEPAAKQRVSHRGRAFRALIEVLMRRGRWGNLQS